MIPSINAMTHAAMILRQQENKWKLQAFVADNFDNEPELAIKLRNMSHDFYQVATHLEEQVKLRTPKNPQPVAD